MAKTILVIDTAFETCQVALAAGDTILLQDRTTSGGGHDRVLAGMVQKLFDAQKITAQQIDTIIVTTGPGRFTGLRVGIAFARGLALVNKTPLVGIMTDEALLLDMAAHHALEKNFALIVAVKRGESFVRFPNSDLEVVPDAELATALKTKNISLVGGVLSPATDEVCRAAGIAISPTVTEPSLASILAVGQKRAGMGVGTQEIVRPYYAASYGT